MTWRHCWQGADLCVDATHPYAVDATRNIRAAAVQAGVEIPPPAACAKPLACPAVHGV
ncbi:MAG: precorrin-6A/cobalt-precorrin-6A reductase [Faecalibacterium prausnitzii]